MKQNIRCLLSIIIVFVIFLGGCSKGSYVMKNSDENSGNEYWKATYDDFDGYKQQSISLDKDTDYMFTVQVITNSGNLELSITGEDGTIYFDENKLQTSTFDIQVSRVC